MNVERLAASSQLLPHQRSVMRTTFDVRVTRLEWFEGHAMAPTTTSSTSASGALAPEQRLELANRLYREYHTRCFWHSPRDLVITEELIPLVVRGLRKHGGRRGFVLSGQIKCETAAPLGSERELT